MHWPVVPLVHLALLAILEPIHAYPRVTRAPCNEPVTKSGMQARGGRRMGER